MIDKTQILPQNPGHLKMLQFNDLLRYAKKCNISMDESFFVKYGFNTSEVDWLFEHKKEEIEMQHYKIQADVNNKEIKKLQKRIVELEQENKGLTNPNRNIIGWKGTNSLALKKLDDNEWLITEYRRAKKSGKIYESNHYISIQHVKNIWKIIQMLTDKENPETYYRAVVRSILIKYNIGLDIDSFNGGRNRSKYLFPLYYYPIKILEYLKHIEYGGRGTIKRLHFNGVKL